MASLALRSRTDALGRLRSEFRPLDSIQPTFSLVSPPYRGNTVSYDGESAFGLWCFCLCFGLLLCFVSGLGVFWCFIPHHHVVLPFLSTMTWARRPHGVRTRGKKIASSRACFAAGAGEPWAGGGRMLDESGTLKWA